MTMLRNASVLVCWFLAMGSAGGADLPSLDPRLEPFRPLLDKTWRGAFRDGRSEAQVVDVMRWERALNGRAIRVLHSVNEGAYGGETLFMWDEKRQGVTYHYFTTAGFMTVGNVSFKDGRANTHEVVSGSAGGVTEVRSTSEMLPDGTFRVRTEHMKDGRWQPGRDVTYREDPAAKVTFR